MSEIYRLSVALLPVLALLAALVYCDSFKLVSARAVLRTVVLGAAVALCALLVNGRLQAALGADVQTFSRYVAPVVEETLKALPLLLLIRTGRVGFPVDAAIYGFALGTGFALAENVYYLFTLETSTLLVWIVRGFGTAALHGATLVIFGIVSRTLSDRAGGSGIGVFLPGWLAAVALHAAYNQFVLPPLYSTLLLLLVLPVLIALVFDRSERATRRWLGDGWNADVEMLEAITTGEIGRTRVGRFLDRLNDRFSGPVVADMLCLLRLHLELGLAARGLILARRTGLRLPLDPGLEAKLAELDYLEKSVGKTGLWVLQPFLYDRPRDIWQRQILKG